MTIDVLLADDDILVRQGLSVLIQAHADLRIVGEAADGSQAIRLSESLRPHVVVMDVRMPGIDGIAATRSITGWPAPRPRVLVLTTFDLDDIVYDALEAGADGFLLKRSTPQELVDGIRTIAEGDALIAPSITRRFINEITRRRHNPTALLADPLTSRERDVLHHLANGLSNAEIAETLVIGHETVKTHIKRICMKTGTRDRTQAVIWAYRNGVVPSG